LKKPLRGQSHCQPSRATGQDLDARFAA